MRHMRMILVGPPGAGKGTQAARLVDSFRIPHISSGDIFRALKGTELGNKVDAYMKEGGLVPDEVTIPIILDRLTQPDCGKGFMLDGFPRTRPQAEALDTALTKASVKLDLVLLIEVPDQLIVDRITGRRSDPKTGKIYHVKFDPPPAGVEVVQRGDDTVEAVTKRLSKYHSETAPIIPYYTQRGILKRVDGVGDPNVVTERIKAVLSS
jgi:adenylate kinase